MGRSGQESKRKKARASHGSDDTQGATDNPLVQAVTQMTQSEEEEEAGAAGDTVEKARSRKINHSAIERRRRDRINDKITELRMLVAAGGIDVSLHKVTILEKVVDHIQALTSENRLLREENTLLRQNEEMYKAEIEAMNKKLKK